MRGRILFFLISLVSWREVRSSAGDMDRNYYYCVKLCYNNRDSLSMTWDRQIFLWNDLDECKYQCMRNISVQRLQNNLPTLKYYGHWPYERIYGVQEPAAAVFSLLNILPHLYYLSSSIRGKFLHPKYYMSNYIVINGFLASIAWMCSTVFHARKIDVTINLDYMSALIFLYHGFWLSLRRALHDLVFKKYPTLSSLMFGLLSLFCGHRLYQMYLGSISFDSHMELCIILAVFQCILWCLWCLFSKTSARHRWFCLFLQLWFGLASLLELFDFPPMASHFDAHSLWHAATIPLGIMWYWFWEQDMQIILKEQDVKSTWRD